MPDAYRIALAACLIASLGWLAALLRVWIRMRDELRRERDLFRDAHITTCRQLREAIEDGQAARAELRELLERAMPAHSGPFVADSGSFGWIPVGARLPASGSDVLMAGETQWCAGDVYSGYYATSEGFVADGDEEIEVTHWMPLPDRPPTASSIARQPDPRAIAGQSSGQSGRWVDTGTNLVWRDGDAPDPVGPWIRVADAVPDYHDEEVVALAGGQPVLAHYSPTGGWRNGYGTELSGVTHWARWPEGSGVAGEEGAADA